MTYGRQCSRCAHVYPADLVEIAFTKDRMRVDASTRRLRTICRPCEQTARDQRKIRNRWTVKARDVIRRHAIRLEVSKDDLTERYGWDQVRLAHDAEFQYGNGCTYCGEQYTAMGHGLSDISLDIVDRAQLPYYRTNTRWCCQTCNRKKGAMSPEAFERDRQVYARWIKHQQAMTAEPQSCGLLF